jgi:hypothetical protein
LIFGVLTKTQPTDLTQINVCSLMEGKNKMNAISTPTILKSNF